MTLFWFAVGALLCSVAGFIFWPLVVAQEHYTQGNVQLATTNKKTKTPAIANAPLSVTASHKQQNIDIFKERLRELETEKAQGTLEPVAFEQLKLELEQTLLNDVAQAVPAPTLPVVSAKHWFIASLMTLAVAVWSVGLYVAFGRSDDYVARLTMQAQGTLKHLGEEPAHTAASDSAKAPDLVKAIELLKTKVKQDPKNISKWFLLANSYAATQQYDKTVETFAEMLKVVPKDSPDYATIKGSYAQALYLVNNETITEPVKVAVAETLKLDAQEPNALTLKGVEAFDNGAYKQAIEHWKQAKVKANPQLASQFIEPAINAAQEKLGITPATIAAKAPAVANTGASLQVSVDITPELKAKVSPEQQVFIFAKAPNSKMPLAVERLTVSVLPTTVTLDDSKAAMPTATLSTVEMVDITARVAFSGGAAAQSGDFFATQTGITLKSQHQPIKLLINQIMP